MAGSTADAMTTPSDVGCEECGVCNSSIFGELPALFESAGQTVAKVTAANNQNQLAKAQLQSNIAIAQINATSAQKIAMEIAVALGILGLVWLGTRRGSSSK